MDDVKDVAEVEQLGRCNGNDLKEPEANVGDGKSQVIADVLTARLLSVANEVRLLVTPHLDRHESGGHTHTHTFVGASGEAEIMFATLKTTVTIKEKEELAFV